MPAPRHRPEDSKPAELPDEGDLEDDFSTPPEDHDGIVDVGDEDFDNQGDIGIDPTLWPPPASAD
ncbi:MAG: hypothetical protein ACKVQQ_04380 [Burkholderiales bacterium]